MILAGDDLHYVREGQEPAGVEGGHGQLRHVVEVLPHERSPDQAAHKDGERCKLAGSRGLRILEILPDRTTKHLKPWSRIK